jgi:hypothetical protein
MTFTVRLYWATISDEQLRTDNPVTQNGCCRTTNILNLNLFQNDISRLFVRSNQWWKDRCEKFVRVMNDHDDDESLCRSIEQTSHVTLVTCRDPRECKNGGSPRKFSEWRFLAS